MKPENSGHEELQNHMPTENDHDPTVPGMAGATDINGENKPSLGHVAGEVAGYAGAHITGGDLTGAHDAGIAMDENLAARGAEQTMWAQQQRGHVGAQTVDLKPASAHPETGLPENATNSENTGGSNASGDASQAAGGDDETQKKNDNDNDLDSASRDAINAAQNNANANSAKSGASAGEPARANMEHDEKFLRLAADFENYKRQSARRANEDSERAARRVFEDLLPVLDNFERALEAARGANDVESLRVGIEFIAQQLRDALRGHGVEVIEAQGQKFDPLLHDALEEVANSGQPEGTVIGEAQRGYSFKGQVLRPSRVRVAGK